MTIAEAETETVTVEELPTHWDVVLRAWEELDLPEGWRAEIIEGDISIMTPPTDEHAHIITLIQKRILVATLPEEGDLHGSEVYQGIDVRGPQDDSLFIPDLVVLPYPSVERDPEHFAGEAQLVVEVTSKSTAGKDRGPKLHGYARAEVPLYLLVDRCDPETRQGEATLYSDPRKGAYTNHTKVPFGKEIHLPEPFDLRIDTPAFQL
ncbi:Uma2 family endonuclease [Nocardiopsis salina]|uniref:Uma2 family endonuclease n=1 Tax=Nocardiopsis salina TaxID=245836 RepID=UPI00034703A3|nr:Uma2 family endonuclease [Nocardiopsis salina]